jgi:DNA-binding transcriptional regulator LsrR (DeoR family)
MNRIEQYIENNGIKKKKLAEKLGISRPTLDREILKNEDGFYNKVKAINENSPNSLVLAGDNNRINQEENGSVIQLYKEIIESQRKTIKSLEEQLEQYKKGNA